MVHLDPHNTSVKGTYCPKTPIPPQLRNFGRYPNTVDWLPGDILLFSDVKPGFIGKTIQKVQTDCGYAPADAMWQHAAIYVGNEHMCEAVFPKLRFHPIYGDVTKRYIRVRRMPDLTREHRYEIAIIGLTKLGSWYGWPELMQVLKLRGRMWVGQKSVNQRLFKRICSQHVTASYGKAIGAVLSKNAGFDRATTPADLSLTTDLQDVAVHWQQIV